MALRGRVFAGLAVFAVAAIVAIQFPHLKLLAQGCHPVPQADQDKYAAAMDFSTRANRAISSGNYSTASDLMDMAISRLGRAYETSLVPDDTDMILQAGKDKSAHFDFKLAARMKQSALQSRLSMFRRKMHVWTRCHALLGKIGLG